MQKQSAGILLYRFHKSKPEVLLVHPGGPFWKNKDNGAWTIPKGEINQNEDPLEAAKREFNEEIGFLPEGEFIQLQPVRQKSGKIVHAWAMQLHKNFDTEKIKSNSFEMEWPPRSGKKQFFPEIDQAAWMQMNEAILKINPAQVFFLQQLQAGWSHLSRQA